MADGIPLTMSFSRGDDAGGIVPPGALQKGAGGILDQLAQRGDPAADEAHFDAVTKGHRPAVTPEEKARRRQDLISRGRRFGKSPEAVMKQIQLEGVTEEKKAPQATKGQVVETGEGFFQFNIDTGRYDIRVGGPKAGKEGKRRIIKDVAGKQRFVDTGKEVFPGVTKPVDAKATGKQKALDTKAAQRKDSAKKKIATALEKIDEALGQTKGWFATGPIAQFTSFIDASQAGQLNNTLLTIKGIIGFNELRELKESSPTGGALGQVSTFELENLQSVIATLKPGMMEDDLRENLKQVKHRFANVRATINLGDMVAGNPDLEAKVNAAISAVDDNGKPMFTPVEIFERLRAAGMK